MPAYLHWGGICTSTKLFNGYRLQPMSLHELDAWSNDLRERIQRVEKYLRAKRTAEIAVHLIDRIALLDDPKRLLAQVSHLLGEKETKISDYHAPYMLAYEDILRHEKQIRATQQRDPQYDFECDVQILPIHSKLLALLFAEQDAYEIVWHRMPAVREYAYWNNTDPPEWLTRRQWQQRERNWDKALGKKGIPALRGFNIQCHDVYSHIDIERVVQAVPGFWARVKDQSQDLVFHDWLGGHKLTTDNYFHLYFEHREWLKTRAGRLAAVRTRHDIAERLPNEITREMLLAPVTKLYKRFHGEPPIIA